MTTSISPQEAYNKFIHEKNRRATYEKNNENENLRFVFFDIYFQYLWFVFEVHEFQNRWNESGRQLFEERRTVLVMVDSGDQEAVLLNEEEFELINILEKCSIFMMITEDIYE